MKITRAEKLSSCIKNGVFSYNWQLRKRHHFVAAKKCFAPSYFVTALDHNFVCQKGLKVHLKVHTLKSMNDVGNIHNI
jgi:hypothetical protein